MDAIKSDFRYAVRRLRASWGFTVAATMTLAVAIGAAASVFGLVDGVLFKSLSVRDADRVFVIWERSDERHLPQFGAAPGNFLDWRAQNEAFSDMAASSTRQFTVATSDGTSPVIGAAVTTDYFELLGATPALGGLPNLEPGSTDVVISHRYWQEAFAGDTGVLGRTLHVDERPRTIVGVMPRGELDATSLWLPLEFSSADRAERGRHDLVVLGRAKPGVTRAAAQQDLERIAQRLASTFPATNQDWTVRVIPLVDQLVGSVRPALVILLAAAACVLLVGVANLAGLFLVRGVTRTRELAIRTALGATHARIARLLIIESTTIGVVAGLLGIGLSTVGIRVLRTLAPPSIPRLSDVGADHRVLAFALGMTALAVLVFGVLPAYQIARHNLSGSLTDGQRTTGSRGRARLQDGLVVLQVVIGLVLLTGAGLFVGAFDHFRHLDAGFRPDAVLTAEVGLPNTRYPTPDRRVAFIGSLLERLRAQPGVDAASASYSVPGMGAGNWGFTIAGTPVRDVSRMPIANINAVSADYFRTLGITVRAGRTILTTDDPRGLKVAVIDELLAKQFFGGRNPIGARLVPAHAPTDTLLVVGIVSTVKQGGLAAESVPELYVSNVQWPAAGATIAVRFTRTENREERVIQRVVGELDRSVAVTRGRMMNDRMLQTVGLTRFSSALASLFATIALILGGAGVYSLLAYTVSLRRREIAVRLALGATAMNVARDVARRALVLTSLGVALGALITWALTGVLSHLFIGIDPHDPLVFAVSAAMVVVVGLVAASVPAVRAARVDPATALKSF